MAAFILISMMYIGAAIDLWVILHFQIHNLLAIVAIACCSGVVTAVSFIWAHKKINKYKL